MSSRRVVRRIGRGVIGLGLGLGALGIGGLSAGAGEAPGVQSFHIVAAADGVGTRISVRGSSAPSGADTPLDVAMPSAQAELSSLGGSQAYAAAPHPGQTVLVGPGLVAGLSGIPVAPPPYPLIVQTDSSGPHDAKSGPAPELEAHSQEDASSATARTGVMSGDAAVGSLRSAATSSRRGTGEFEGSAESSVIAFSAGDVLKIGKLTSRAFVTRRPGSDPERRSELTIENVTVAGQTVALTPEGLTVAGRPVTLPGNPLGEALAGAGIAIRYLSAINLPDGVVAPALEVTLTRQVSPADSVTTTLTLGQARATATLGALGADSAVIVSPGDGLNAPPPEPPTTAADGKATVSDTTPVPVAHPVETPSMHTDAAEGQDEPPPVVAPSAPTVDASLSAPRGPSGSLPGPTAAALTRVSRVTPAGFYAIVLIAAALAIGGGITIRLATPGD